MNRDGSGNGNESSSGDENGDEDGNEDENEEGVGKGGGEGKSAIYRRRVVDAIRPFYFAHVIISADRGWCLQAINSSVCKARYLYARIVLRG